jgi:hypothetical protein
MEMATLNSFVGQAMEPSTGKDKRSVMPRQIGVCHSQPWEMALPAQVVHEDVVFRAMWAGFSRALNSSQFLMDALASH